MIHFIKQIRLFEAFPQALEMTHDAARKQYLWEDTKTGWFGFVWPGLPLGEWVRIPPGNVKGVREFSESDGHEDEDMSSAEFVLAVATAPKVEPVAAPAPAPAKAARAVHPSKGMGDSEPDLGDDESPEPEDRPPIASAAPAPVIPAAEVPSGGLTREQIAALQGPRAKGGKWAAKPEV